MERIITVTSKPIPAKKPAHSNATYEAPTTKVFPGQYGKEKRSSLVMPNSFAPGISGYLGRSPVVRYQIVKSLKLFKISVQIPLLMKALGREVYLHILGRHKSTTCDKLSRQHSLINGLGNVVSMNAINPCLPNFS